MLIPEVEEILEKYKKDEEEIELSLKNCEKKIGAHMGSSFTNSELSVSLEEAKERNKQLLKELEIVKGNLRAKSIFSPAEMQWEKICHRYQSEPSLPVTSWRCHLSAFV